MPADTIGAKRRKQVDYSTDCPIVPSGVGLEHRFLGAQLDAMGVVDEAIEEGIGGAPAAEVLMPVADGQLRRDYGCPCAVALLKGFKQILLFPIGEAASGTVT